MLCQYERSGRSLKTDQSLRMRKISGPSDRPVPLGVSLMEQDTSVKESKASASGCVSRELSRDESPSSHCLPLVCRFAFLRREKRIREHLSCTPASKHFGTASFC